MADLRTMTVLSSEPGWATVSPGSLRLPIVGRQTIETGARVAVLFDRRQGVIIGPVRDAAGQPIPDPGGGSGTSNHGALTGLADDDHPQYLLRGDVPGLFRYYAATVPANLSAASSVTVPITFPPGRFAVPVVTASISSAAGGAGTLIVRPISITPAGCSLLVNSATGASVTANTTVHVHVLEAG